MRNWIRNQHIRNIFIAAAYLLLWQLAALAVGSPLLLPGPAATLSRLFALLVQPDCWGAIGLTLGRILAGFLLGVLMGILLGALTAASKLADALLAPLRSVVKATPVTSFILLALLWFSASVVPVWISFLMVLPIVWANVAQALAETGPAVDRDGKGVPFFRMAARAGNLHTVGYAAVSCRLHHRAGICMEIRCGSGILSLPRRAVGTYLYQAKITLETVDLFRVDVVCSLHFPC